MKQGDLAVAWERVFFIFDREIPGGFLKAVDHSASDYLTNGKLAIDRMFNKGICRLATGDEKEKYNQTVQNSRFKKHILQTELI